MAKKSIDTLGDKEVRRNLGIAIKEIERGIMDAIKPAAKKVLNKAQGKVPVDSGKLKRSAKISRTINENDMIMAGIGYDTEYAIFVHEIPNRNGYKWFETAINQSKDGVTSDLKQGISRGIRRAKRKIKTTTRSRR